MKRQIVGLLLGICVMIGASFFVENIASAQSSEVKRLQEEISARNSRLGEIEAEIAKYQMELQKVGAEKSTLQNAINKLELERKKISADINYTQNRIGSTDLEINKINIEIGNTETTIGRNESAIEETLRRINETDQEPLLITMLQNKNLSEFWGSIEELQQVRNVMRDEIRKLALLKTLLEEKLGENRVKRDELVDLKDQYTDQQSILSNNKAEKNELLKQTQNEEAEYQRLLAEKQAAKEQIVKELRDFESKLQFILDPNTIPQPGMSIFNWPLESVRVTQYFGGSEFAKRNPGIYGGRAYHPGLDLGAARGTKITAPLAGVVRATGNTDLVPGCYSWGKWTLIDHANGLSTLYAHQDLISVSAGQQVETGEVIGYTGNTGYSTGPHLHFTVYAKAGVTVRKFNEIKTVTSCGPASTPVAATEAYIDPILYLPAL